jgi:hypothetical protein
MTTRKDLPEQAQEEPPIRSPEELAELAAKRVEKFDEMQTADEELSLADPGSPLRVPGELSSKPREKAEEERSGQARRGRG